MKRLPRFCVFLPAMWAKSFFYDVIAVEAIFIFSCLSVAHDVLGFSKYNYFKKDICFLLLRGCLNLMKKYLTLRACLKLKPCYLLTLKFIMILIKNSSQKNT